MSISLKTNHKRQYNPDEYYQFLEQGDASIAIRTQEGGKWTVLRGDRTSSEAAKFCEVQNRAWKDWMVESISRYDPKSELSSGE